MLEYSKCKCYSFFFLSINGIDLYVTSGIKVSPPLCVQNDKDVQVFPLFNQMVEHPKVKRSTQHI